MQPVKIGNGKNWIVPALLAMLVVLFFGKILFTDQIIRASDVITQFFWAAKHVHSQSLGDYLGSFPQIFQANWEPLNDGGRTLEGGWNAIGLLFHRYLIQHFFPFPASIAWLAVLSLAWGGIGTYCYCRLIGLGRFGSFVAGLLFALCTENASLINAGHIQKIETIGWFPWVILFLEKSFRSGRLFHYAMTALMLALQFFNMHWQISFYTCLAVGAYWFFHAGARCLEEKKEYLRKGFGKEFLLAAVMVVLFFTTIAMSFAPLYSWSQQSERGDAVTSAAAGSGAASAGKGIGFEEGMGWSMPPEEILTYFVPGLVGYSRQEAGDVPAPGQVYYWGRMHFTQTGDYLGLLPWFLIPLPLIFRRDRYTWFFTFLMGITLLMALGKYTFVYRFMFEHLPGFSSFRVPKMILFLFAFGAAVLTGRGIDLLARETLERGKIKRWLVGSAAFVALIALFGIFLAVASDAVLPLASGVIDLPTRYQSDSSLIGERYAHMIREAGIAFGVGLLYLAALVAWFRKWLPTRYLLPVLLLFLLGDLWRVNERFLVLTAPPQADKRAAKSEIVQFLESRIDHYRMQPLNADNGHYYADYGLPNISAYVTISEKRYKEFLESISLVNTMPDIMNLKYLVMPSADYEAQKEALSGKYTPVFTSTTGSMVLENRTVLPKAWLVPSVAVVENPQQRLSLMSSSPQFNPELMAFVESQPPLAMAPFPSPVPGKATVQTFEPNRIVVKAQTAGNSLLVIGEKYYRWWYAYVDGKNQDIHPVNHVLRGVYLPPGEHSVEFVFDPLPFKVGKWLTLVSFAFFAFMLGWEAWIRKKVKGER